MKILSLTTKYFLTLVLTLLTVWCGVLYFSIQSSIYTEIDEYLTFRENEIIESIKNNPTIIDEKPLYHSDFEIAPINEKKYHKLSKHNENFKNIKRYIRFEKEKEPFRIKISAFKLNNNFYALTTITPLMNSEDILFTILVDIFIFSILIFILVYTLNRIVLRKLWKPFYDSLITIKQYKLDKESPVSFENSNITEFKELNESIIELIQNNLGVYKNQKEFIENAAHEMQTPLGIIQSKTELLMEQSINQEQAFLIEGIAEQIERLSKLNKTLLLLSKIENNQFPENKALDVSTIIEACCNDFNDLIEYKNLTVEITLESIHVNMHEGLASILFSNLIKNAVNHNYTNGYIHIHLGDNKLILSNSGEPNGFEPELIFERFTKKSNSSFSNGLGLSIVKKICALYNFKISYNYSNKEHSIVIIF